MRAERWRENRDFCKARIKWDQDHKLSFSHPQTVHAPCVSPGCSEDRWGLWPAVTFWRICISNGKRHMVGNCFFAPSLGIKSRVILVYQLCLVLKSQAPPKAVRGEENAWGIGSQEKPSRVWCLQNR